MLPDQKLQILGGMAWYMQAFLLCRVGQPCRFVLQNPADSALDPGVPTPFVLIAAALGALCRLEVQQHSPSSWRGEGMTFCSAYMAHPILRIDCYELVRAGPQHQIPSHSRQGCPMCMSWGSLIVLLLLPVAAQWVLAVMAW